MLGHLSKNNGHLVLWYDASGSGYTSQIKEINRSRATIEEVIQEFAEVSKTKSHEVFIWCKNMKNDGSMVNGLGIKVDIDKINVI